MSVKGGWSLETDRASRSIHSRGRTRRLLYQWASLWLRMAGVLCVGFISPLRKSGEQLGPTECENSNSDPGCYAGVAFS